MIRALAKEHGRGAFLFGVIGVFNMATDFALFSVAVLLGLHPVPANVGSFLIANIQSYIVNASITFRREGRAAEKSVLGYFKFAAAHVLGLVISTGFIIAFSDAIGPLLAKAASVVFAATSNYLMSAYFVFRRRNIAPAPAPDHAGET